MRPMGRSLCVLSFLLLLPSAASVAQVGNTPRPAPTTRVIAVLSAMTLEIEALGQQLTDKTEMIVQGIRFTTGSLKGRRVVLAHSGMGKVNAATAAALLVEQFQPTHVLFTGIAGGLNPDLRPGDVVIGVRRRTNPRWRTCAASSQQSLAAPAFRNQPSCFTALRLFVLPRSPLFEVALCSCASITLPAAS